MKAKEISYIIERILSLLAAIILLQTLYFKFSASEVSVHIFTELHAEPWGRILTGIIELIAGLLLIFRRTSVIGAILGIGLMVGAMLSHLFLLGIEIQDDSGLLFILAGCVLICCIIVFYIQHNEIRKFFRRK